MDEKTMDDAPAHYNSDSASGWAAGYNAALAELSAAMSDVVDERRRQVAAEGWTPEHDDKHGDGALLTAAVCYAQRRMDEDRFGSVPPSAPAAWPWSREWWKPKDRRRDLVRAAALLVAEIERIDRGAAKRAA